MKKARYHEMSRIDIRQFLSRSSYKTLKDMIIRDQERERELDLEMERKKRAERGQSGSSGKKPKISDHIYRSQKSHDRCGKCERMHEGTC